MIRIVAIRMESGIFACSDEDDEPLYEVLDDALKGQRGTEAALRTRWGRPYKILDRARYAMSVDGHPLERQGWEWKRTNLSMFPSLQELVGSAGAALGEPVKERA